jgi:hypothetical protein
MTAKPETGYFMKHRSIETFRFSFAAVVTSEPWEAVDRQAA